MLWKMMRQTVAAALAIAAFAAAWQLATAPGSFGQAGPAAMERVFHDD